MRDPVANISIRNLSVGYGSEVVISGLNLSVKGPGLVQIIGPNGAGKTTLIKAILGILKPLKGEIRINGRRVDGNPSVVGPIVGYVPQTFPLENDRYPLTPWELTLNYLLLHERKWPRLLASNRDKERVARALRAVGLPMEKWYERFWELSRGEKQRVLIARAIVHEPNILLMDEPLSSVDPLGRVELAKLIGNLSKGTLTIVSSHDPVLLLPYTKTILLLNRGYYIYGKPGEVLKVSVLKEVYGEAVLRLGDHVHICDSHLRS